MGKIRTYLKRFAGLGTAWKFNEFFRAKIKLMLLYVGIMAAMLVVFDAVLVYKIGENLSQDSGISDRDAVRIALSYNPGGNVVNVKEELADGKKYYEVKFSDGVEIAVDAENGKSAFEHDLMKSSDEMFQDYLEDALFWVNLLMLLLMAGVGYFFADRSLKPLVEKVQEQKRFTADAAHELRNPLAAMQAAAESVLRKKRIPAAESREVLEGILDDALRLSSLTEGLLQLVSNDGVVEKKFQNVDVKEIVDKVIQKLTPLAEQKKVHFKVRLDNFSRMASAEMLEMMVFNLIHNAIKFSHKDGEVVVSLDSNGVLNIQDFGIGIAQKHVAYIFDRFYKAEPSRDFSLGGSGLGLSIVSEVAKRHNAEIVVSSNIGKGTLFKILL